MKWGLSILTILAALAFAGRPGAAAAADGKALFTQLKCNSCHTVTSQGIEAAKEDGEAEEGEEASKPSDLSNVGADHNASWIKDWLMKKVDLDGKKHRKKFAGTPEDLEVLATWMAGLKEAKK